MALLTRRFLSLSLFLVIQFGSASRACVGGHRTGGQGALYLRMGLLHRADCVHPQGCAHARHRLLGLRPRGTGTDVAQQCWSSNDENLPQNVQRKCYLNCGIFFFIVLSKESGLCFERSTHRAWSVTRNVQFERHSINNPNSTRELQAGFCSWPARLSFWMTHLWLLQQCKVDSCTQTCSTW